MKGLKGYEHFFRGCVEQKTERDKWESIMTVMQRLPKFLCFTFYFIFFLTQLLDLFLVLY